MEAENNKASGNIFEIFYSKLPDSAAQLLPCYDRCKLVTFLTPYYMARLDGRRSGLYKEFDYIASDGISPVWIQKWLGRPKSVRLSFDMTSLAVPVFNDIISHHKALYVLGGRPDIIGAAVCRIRDRFRGIRICGWHHGYIKGMEDDIVADILTAEANVVIVGMGELLQDEMSVRLKRAGFIGTVYTCGGFLHQIVNKTDYPGWVNKYNLRMFYRWVHEKGVFQRFPTHLYGMAKYAEWLMKQPKG